MPSVKSPEIRERDQAMAALYTSGVSLTEVARVHDVSVGTVSLALQRMDIARRRVGRPGKTRQEDKTKRRWYAIKCSYDLTREQWDAKLIEQSGLCAACGKQMSGSKDAAVDHDHVTNQVRSLLCHRCNIGMPYVEDAIFRERALAYLERHRG